MIAPPEPGYVTRCAGVRAVIHPIPAGIGPNTWLWAGELRTEDDHPWHGAIRVAPYTDRGKALVLASLTRLARGPAVFRVDRRIAI